MEKLHRFYFFGTRWSFLAGLLLQLLATRLLVFRERYANPIL